MLSEHREQQILNLPKDGKNGRDFITLELDVLTGIIELILRNQGWLIILMNVDA